jgi:hypothetical protein
LWRERISRKLVEMQLRRFTAIQFRRKMERGLNRPFLVIGAPQDGGERRPLVVKSRVGYANRPEAMLKELFALLLARELGLKAPEPVMVEIPEGLDWAAADFPEHAELIRQSIGWNVGTVHLGDAWKPWSTGIAPRSIPVETLETAYAFDAMVENPDREAANPNLLWRGDELAVLDFDKAFGFLRIGEKDARPWRRMLLRLNLERHCLHSQLPERKEGEILGICLWDAFEEWCLGRHSAELSAAIVEGFPDPNLDLKRIEGYLTKLATDPEDFFRHLTAASRL